MDIQPLRTKNEDLLELERLLNEIGHLSDEIAKENVSVLPVSAKKKLWQISHNIELANSRLWSYCCYQDDNRWHPASDTPVIPNGKDRVKLVAMAEISDGNVCPIPLILDKGEKWDVEDCGIRLWCYQPKED